MRFLTRVYFRVVYLFTWLLFALVGLLLNAVCAVRAIFPYRADLHIRVRGLIRWLFESLTKWYHASRVVQISWNNFEVTPPAGTVYIANHPSLIDAPLLLGKLSNAITIFKPALLRNPFIGPAAVLAGYAAGDRGVDAIRDAAEKVAGGCSLLIFPEGTRTRPDQTLGEFKAGFALIARRAQAPIRLICIRATPGVLTKGSCWWWPRQIPLYFEITLGDELPTLNETLETTTLAYTRLAKMLADSQLSGESCPRTSC